MFLVGFPYDRYYSGIKEAGAPNEAQQNSKPQLRIPERFPAKSSNSHNKSAGFSPPAFSQETQFFTGGLILPIFHAKMVVSRLGPGYKNCHQSEKEENQTFEPAKVILSPSQPAVAGWWKKVGKELVPFPLSCLEIADASSRNKNPFYGGNDLSQNKIYS